MHDHLSDDQHDVNADEHGLRSRGESERSHRVLRNSGPRFRPCLATANRARSGVWSAKRHCRQRARHPASASSCFPVAFPGTQARHQIRCLVPIHLRGGSVHHSGGEPQLHRERLFLHPGPGMFGSQRQRLLTPPRQHDPSTLTTSPFTNIATNQHFVAVDHASSVLDITVTTTLPTSGEHGHCVEVPVTDTAHPHVGGFVSVYGPRCHSPICDVVLEMQLSVDNFKLKFVAGRMHSTHDVSDFSLAGGTGNARIPIFRDGRGLIPRGALSFTAQGSTGGTTLVSSDTNADPIHFQLDFKSGMLSVRDAHLTLPGGNHAKLTLRATFGPSALETLTTFSSSDEAPPSIAITSPRDGAVIHRPGDLVLSFAATDPSGVAERTGLLDSLPVFSGQTIDVASLGARYPHSQRHCYGQLQQHGRQVRAIPCRRYSAELAPRRRGRQRRWKDSRRRRVLVPTDAAQRSRSGGWRWRSRG